MRHVHKLSALFPFVMPDCTVIPKKVPMMIALACLGATNSVVVFEGAETAGIPRIEMVWCLSEFGSEPKRFLVT